MVWANLKRNARVQLGSFWPESGALHTTDQILVESDQRKTHPVWKARLLEILGVLVDATRRAPNVALTSRPGCWGG